MDKHFPQMVILAGGESSRLWPLPDKSLVRFLDRSLFENQLATYIKLGFRDIAVVCNHDNEPKIKEILAQFTGIDFQVFIQKKPRGMGDALLTLAPLLDKKDEALPVYICQVHDIFEDSFHEKMLEAYFSDPAATWIAAYKVEKYFPGGYLKVTGDNVITGIVEKPPVGQEPSDLVNIVAHIHPDLALLLERIRLEYASAKPGDDHYERAMDTLMRERTYKAVPYSGIWRPIKFPWDVLPAMRYFLDTRLFPQETPEVPMVGVGVTLDAGKGPIHIGENCRIEEGVHISGPVFIGDNVRIFHGADIRGPVYIGDNVLVGQYACVRESMVSRDCVVGAGSEVNRSYLGTNAWLHAAMVLDSVLADSVKGKETNLSARVVTANLRTDRGNVKSTIKGQRIDSGRDKLGAIVGPGSFVAVNVMIMPGVKLGEGCFVGPSTVAKEDIPDHCRYYVVQEYDKKVENDG